MAKKTKAKPRTRRKKNRDYYETTEGRAYLTYLYRDLGYTDQQTADDIGVTRRTILNWRKASPIIDNAISLGKAHTDTLVENSLLQQAMKGNVEACKYWLQNRKPDKWKAVRLDTAGDKERKERSNAQIVAIADLINTPQAERVLQDFMTPTETTEETESDESEGEE